MILSYKLDKLVVQLDPHARDTTNMVRFPSSPNPGMATEVPGRGDSGFPESGSKIVVLRLTITP